MSRWTSLKQMLCCVAGKDVAPDPQQQQICNGSDTSDPESIPDQPVQRTPPQGVSHIEILSRWEDREAMYKKHIHDLEQELTAALKIKKALSHHLYEMGRLVFPEMDPRDSTSPSFVEKLKVYLECLQLERQQLEKRALWAEQTVWETENELSDLEKLLNSLGYRGTRRLDYFFLPGGIPPPPPPPLSTQPIRFFFSKMHRKSPEKKEAEESSGKWVEESFAGGCRPKRSPVKDLLAKIPRRSPPKLESTEAETVMPLVKRDLFTEPKLPRTTSHRRTGSCWLLPEHSGHSPAKASLGYGDTCVAQVHGHWDPHAERAQESLAQIAEDDVLSTTSTLLVALPSAGGSEDIRVSPGSSVPQDISPTLLKSKMENCNVWSEMQHRAIMAGDCAIQTQEEGSTSKEEECVTLGSISLKPVGLSGQVSENLSGTQTDSQKLDNPKTKVSQDLSGNATLQTEASFSGKDFLKTGESPSISIVHSSNQIADLEPGTTQTVLAEQASCRPDLPEKPGKEFSSLELILKPDLPSSSTKAPETNKSLGEKRVLEDSPGLPNKTDQLVPMEENPAAVFPPQLKPEELLPSDLCEPLASVSSKSPQPASLTEESPSSLAEEAAAEEN